MKDSIHGKRISREEALEGLGDPSTWAAHKKKVMKSFKANPKKTKKSKKDT